MLGDVDLYLAYPIIPGAHHNYSGDDTPEEFSASPCD
jgi:hypothetical protein